jgi:malate dehydrogenase
MKRYKVSIIGAGQVGSTCAHWLASKKFCDVVLLDILEGVSQGKALDLLQAGPIEGFDSFILGTNKYEDTRDSDIVVITSGLARKPGMSRDDLLAKNEEIVGDVTKNIAKYSPNAFIIMVTNPLDAMAHLAKKISGFPKNRVMGMAGILDTARFRTFLALELKCSVEDVTAFVLGGHGDEMVPLVRYSTMAGIPISSLLPKEKISAIVDRARKGGAEIVNLLKTGSAYYAPSRAVVEMIEAIIFDKKRILPVSAYCEGEFGVNGFYFGVPVILGKNGVEKIITLELTGEEKNELTKSIEAVKGSISKLKA